MLISTINMRMLCFDFMYSNKEMLLCGLLLRCQK